VNPRDMARMWLKERAAELRKDAKRIAVAYTGGYMRDACLYVAQAYREAAGSLDHAADGLDHLRDREVR